VARTLSHKVPGPQQPKRAGEALAIAGRGDAPWDMQQGPHAPSPTPVAHTLDAGEIARFARHADEWWDEQGKFRPLHQIAPLRLAFLREEMLRHFRRSGQLARPFAGLSVLDVGCGGGLICEPLARLGAHVTGLDPAPENIAAARAHAAGQGLAVEYRAGRVEELAAEGLAFDALVCFEVVEHVPDPAAFLKACAALLRPGAPILLSTINRTVKSYLLAIVAAEYVLRWLPVGTHRWDRFVTPQELAGHCAAAGLAPGNVRGLVYNPFADGWALAADTDVNYFAAAVKRAG
jgi:2-polyprenyl-6-hydroxyphenyl methylase/3-demethylubiquinone-9 3-methyltransferase